MAERTVSLSLRRVPESVAKEFKRSARSHGGQAAWFEALVNLRKEAVNAAAHSELKITVQAVLEYTGTEEVRA